MSARRIPPTRNRPLPSRAKHEAPAASGEYRITRPGHYSLIDDSVEAIPEGMPSGRMLDDALEFDVDADGALELDCLPSSHRSRVEMPRQSTPEPPLALVPRTPSHEMLPAAMPWPAASPQARQSSSKIAAVRTPSSSIATADTHAALVAFAGFGDPPAGIWGAPAYALRVVLRRHALKQDLERARHSEGDFQNVDAPLVQRAGHFDELLAGGGTNDGDDAAVQNPAQIFVSTHGSFLVQNCFN